MYVKIAMSKTFKLVDTGLPIPSTSIQQSTETNWKQCIICQEHTGEALTCPSKSKRKDVGSGYRSLAEQLVEFNELGELPLQLERLDEGDGIEAAMVANNAQYHQSCKLKYNNTKLQRAQKRALASDTDSADHDLYTECKRRRSRNSEVSSQEVRCFFCGQSSGTIGLHEAATFQIDERVRACAVLLGDTELLAKLSPGDMVALDAKYHTKCLVGLYNRARKAKADGLKGTDQKEMFSGIVFAELVMYIEEAHLDGDTAPVFKLVDLAQLYNSRMEQLGLKVDTRLHTTRLKERLLAHFPDLRAQKKGRDVLLVFEEDIGAALAKACELDSDCDAVHLARAAQIVRRNMFGEAKSFTGFPSGCQKSSLPPLLLALMNMILEGPSIKDQSRDTTPAALSISQLLKFNCVKHKRAQSTVTVRHSTAQEKLVDRLFHLGLSISYDRVLRITAQLGSSVCAQFNSEQVVCPPKLRGNVFTTAAVDNIFQHPTLEGEGVDRNISAVESMNLGSKSVDFLPHFYTDVPPVTSNMKKLSVPATSLKSLSRDTFKQHVDKEYLWLDHARLVIEGEIETLDNTSWAAYHANHQPSEDHVICRSALLPLFLESAHTVAMIKHSMDVINNAVKHLNPGQTPVITFDQPLYALAKQIQWKWPEKYGDEKFVIMFGGLHIEMAALKTVGDWLKGSGWVQALVQAGITTPGTADSFLQAAHVARTRRAHQVTVTALYILKRRAYDCYCQTVGEEESLLEFKDWCNQREQACPHFHYWAIVMELQLCLLVYVRSLRQPSFTMYLDALTELAPWFHALDHTNYARWIPVHLRDMAELPTKHPEVAKNFNAGNFTVRKTKRAFSSIPIDQAHEQNNACIKGDGGAVGLTDNPRALRRWMVAGPEVARVIEEFHDEHHQWGRKVDTHHHDQTPSVQTSFTKDVHSLVSAFEDSEECPECAEAWPR